MSLCREHGAILGGEVKAVIEGTGLHGSSMQVFFQGRGQVEVEGTGEASWRGRCLCKS